MNTKDKHYFLWLCEKLTFKLDIMILTIIILAYVLNVFLNRYIYFQLQKKDSNYYPNPMAVTACFLSVIGTISLLAILLGHIESDFFKLK